MSNQNQVFGRFFLPGPTEVRPAVLEAQARPMIGHRTSEIQKLMECLQAGLKTVFQTERPVFVSTSSATGLMEASVRNGAPRTVLSLVNGAFSERFAQIARDCGREVDTIEVDWGDHVPVDRVADRLKDRHYDVVTVVHSETSTGVLSPVAELAELVSAIEDTLLLVDSVTGAGGAEVRADEWGLDFVLTGSQKALALPPGLAFGVASEAMMARSARMEGKGHYFDFVEFQERLRKMQTPTTPAVSLMYALAEQLGYIAEETIEGRWQRHRAMRERCVTWVEEEMAGRGLSVLAAPGFRSPTVTCIRLPEGRTGPEIAGALRERGWVIAPGYGRLKETSIRIGHMGDHTVDELDGLLSELDEVLS